MDRPMSVLRNMSPCLGFRSSFHLLSLLVRELPPNSEHATNDSQYSRALTSAAFHPDVLQLESKSSLALSLSFPAASRGLAPARCLFTEPVNPVPVKGRCHRRLVP